MSCVDGLVIACLPLWMANKPTQQWALIRTGFLDMPISQGPPPKLLLVIQRDALIL